MPPIFYSRIPQVSAPSTQLFLSQLSPGVWVSTRILRDSSHAVTGQHFCWLCWNSSSENSWPPVLKPGDSPSPTHTLKLVLISGISHSTPVPKKCRKVYQLRETGDFYVSLCWCICVLSYCCAICHAICLLGRCLSDGHLTSMWLWVELVNVVITPPTDIQDGLVQHRDNHTHWHQK